LSDATIFGSPAAKGTPFCDLAVRASGMLPADQDAYRRLQRRPNPV
jgi:hypothetical protein